MNHPEVSRAIDALRYVSRFTDELPADPRDDARTRQVLGACYSRVRPTPVRQPALLALVPEVCALLDLDPTPTDELVQTLAGNRLAPGMNPYAACYGGHQFGNWAGQLGDGRAITLGEVRNGRDEVWEVQLKGAGPTPYSRRADGRAVLRSSLRELVCSEAMHHLGVPTTRALALTLTGDSVERDMFYDGRPRMEPGAITCRVAPSFVRFGHFEIHASRNDLATLEKLVRFTARTLYPAYAAATPDDIAAMFDEVAERTAAMVVHWLRVGFVHGVMNTDNLSILGLTIDYGPYGWLDTFDPGWTPNTTDAQGRRYRFGNQPRIAHWNLAQLGNALAPLLPDVAPLQRTIDRWSARFASLHQSMMLSKLGLDADDPDQDEALLDALFAMLTVTEIDPTIFYRRLATLRAQDASTPWLAHRDALSEAFYDPRALDNETIVQPVRAWIERYLSRARELGIDDDARARRMNAVNPLYIPRNYLVQEVIDRTSAEDTAALHELLDVLRRPYEPQPGRERFAAQRPEWARVKPGCSMLSCSS
jgi:uncharacterized protein YdiU (UPF0061 family)